MDISKERNFSQWYTEITKRAELCDIRYNVKGFVVFLPWSVITMKLMYEHYEKELERRGHLPAWFPAVIPEENLKRESEHVKEFIPEVFWITGAGGTRFKERLAMRPTSETAMYKMYSLWMRGWKDLPLKLYQSCQVWRHETKATRPFIRSREFYWIEAHDAFAKEDEAKEQVREDMKMAENVVHKLFCIPFLFFQRPEWDKFPGAVHTFAADTLMPDGKVIQQPSTHLLGQNFAKAFNITFLNEKGKKEYAWQTCYGPAISRIYASLISIHGDNKGLIIPFLLAPLQVIIVPILKKGEEKDVLGKCKKMKGVLEKAGIRTRVDSGEETPGFKFNKWEEKGVPIRMEIGKREVEQGEATLHRRDTGKRERIKDGKAIERICALGEEIDKCLRKKADEWFLKQIHTAKTMDELGKKLKEGGFTKVDLCSIGMDGEKCAEKIKEEFAGNVRGKLFGKNERPGKGAKCIVCGKEAKEVIYVARQY